MTCPSANTFIRIFFDLPHIHQIIAELSFDIAYDVFQQLL